MSRFQSRLAMLGVAAVVAVTASNVNSVSNSPPVGINDHFDVVEGTLLVVDAPGLLVNDFDPDGDPIASGFHSDPPDGTVLAMAPDGAFMYEPDPGFVGVDSFDYAVRDDLGSFTGLVVHVAITVTPTTHPMSDPTAVAAGAIADPKRSSGVGPSAASTDPRLTMAMFSSASSAASTPSSRGVPAELAVTGTTSNVMIPAALFGAGLLVIAYGVRRARTEADERFEQA